MELFQAIYDFFINLPFPVRFFALIGLGMIGSVYYSNYTVRKKRTYVTQKLSSSNQPFIPKHAKCTSSAIAPLGFKVVWSRAEVIFTTNSILIFSYYNYFGLLPMYQGFIQLYQPGCELPEKMTKQNFIPIGSLDFNADNLQIKYRYGSIMKANCTVTLKGIELDGVAISKIKELMEIESPRGEVV